MKTKIPYIKIDGLKEESDVITELNDNAIRRVEECCQRHIGKSNTDTNIAYLQTELDNLCGGKRLFQVEKKYKIKRFKTKVVDANGNSLSIYDEKGNPIENLYREEKELIPWELEVIYVGDIPITQDDDIKIKITYGGGDV